MRKYILTLFSFLFYVTATVSVARPNHLYIVKHDIGIAPKTVETVAAVNGIEFEYRSFASINEYTTTITSEELKGTMPKAIEFYLIREGFLRQHAVRIPKTYTYNKTKIYLLNCAIKLC